MFQRVLGSVLILATSLCFALDLWCLVSGQGGTIATILSGDGGWELPFLSVSPLIAGTLLLVAPTSSRVRPAENPRVKRK